MSDALEDLLAFANANSSHEFNGIYVHDSDFVFEESVKFNCFYCGKYDLNWKCPPNLPELDYARMFSEYERLAFIWIDLPFDENTFASVRSESSVELHKMLIRLEKRLWDLDRSTAVSFIGGSCKLCKNGCGKEKCRNPYQSRSPLEATGLNIVKTAAAYGIDITFPPQETLMRLGLLAW